MTMHLCDIHVTVVQCMYSIYDFKRGYYDLKQQSLLITVIQVHEAACLKNSE